MLRKMIGATILTMSLGFAATGCGTASEILIDTATETAATLTSTAEATASSLQTENEDGTVQTVSYQTNTEGDALLDVSDIFTEKDLQQTPDTTGAETIVLTSGEDVTITEAGIYVLTGTASNATLVVEAGDEAKIQLVLDGVDVTNEDAPVIYIKSGDKVFITTTDSENHMAVTGTYVTDGDTNLDGVIFSKSDLDLNGTGSLIIESASGNGVVAKDDFKITGGTYDVTAAEDGFEANDSIAIYDGTITVVSGQDAFHSENEDDLTLGYIYIQGGTLNILAGDDGVRGTSIVRIDGGVINIEKAVEGIEGTYVIINGGDIDIYATDDGINATKKSNYEVVIEINGGDIQVTMGSGDTDAIDANGSIYVNGGTIDLTCGSSFDADVTAQLNGGSVTVNGEVITEITQMQMGGHMGGGMDGSRVKPERR